MNQHNWKRFFLFAGILMVGLLVNGCSSDGDSEPVRPTFSSLWNHLFADCSVACHNPNAVDGSENGPNLADKAQFINSMANKTTAGDYPQWIRVGTCTTVNMIAPGDANNSTVAGSLIQSVSTTLSAANGGCITSYNEHSVKQAHITDQAVADALVQWINSGALNN